MIVYVAVIDGISSSIHFGMYFQVPLGAPQLYAPKSHFKTIPGKRIKKLTTVTLNMNNFHKCV